MVVGGKRRITIHRSLVCNLLGIKANPKLRVSLTEEPTFERNNLSLRLLSLSPVSHGLLLSPPLLPEAEPKKSAVAVPILPVDSPTIPSGTCTKLKKEWADRLIAISPFSYASFKSISPYNIPFVDSTFPANRSSSIVA
jgi:hypothetical protein